MAVSAECVSCRVGTLQHVRMGGGTSKTVKIEYQGAAGGQRHGQLSPLYLPVGANN